MRIDFYFLGSTTNRITNAEWEECFHKLLRKLFLSEYYHSPYCTAYTQGLTANDVSQCTNSMQETTPDDHNRFIAYLYLKNVLMLNSNVVYSVFGYNTTEEKYQFDQSGTNLDDLDDSCDNASVVSLPGMPSAQNNNSFHPQDVALVTYLSSSIQLRRQYTSKLYECKLAVPIIIPKENGLVFAKHALNAIVLSDQGQEISSTNKKINIISFLRLANRVSPSKSKLINELLGKCHDTFYHRDCPLGERERMVSNGIVEGAWFYPTESSGSDMLFLNLRGKSCDYKQQVSFLGDYSSVGVIVLQAQEIASVAFKEMHAIFIRPPYKTRVIVILLHGIGSLTDHKAACKALFGGQNPVNCDFLLGFKGGNDLNPAELKQKLHEMINTTLTANSKLHTLEDIADQHRQEHGFDVDAEINHDMVAATIPASRVISQLDSMKYLDKEMILPLQHPWHELVGWTKKHEQHFDSNAWRNTVQTQENTTKDFKAVTKQNILECRQRQLNTLSKSTFIETFMRELLTCFDSQIPNQLPCFVELIKGFLDNRSRQILPDLTNKYSQITRKLQGAIGADKTLLLKQLSKIETELTDQSFDIYLPFREMGQVYEALKSEAIANDRIPNVFSEIHRYPDIMSSLIMSGFPLELMDGDASGVPINWIAAVLDCLHRKLGDKKMLVVSVLGVQSSGKSTLLNSMFGVDFCVGAGRCTKGVYAQLLPVQREGGDGFSFEYILLLDTEGIRAFGNSSAGIKRDNEISTLVIGLSDLTIMNVMGEHFNDLQDVIQIAVHAFLRMHMQNIERKCIFIHQGVPATNATNVLASRRNNLVHALDKAARDTAEMENIHHIEGFAQIMQFDSTDHTFYLGNKWKGKPPMAPSDSDYHSSVQRVKSFIFDYMKNGRHLKTISQFKDHLQVFWQAIVSEEFVFNFRNSDEIKAYAALETAILDRYFDLDTYAMNECYFYAMKEFAKTECKTREDLDMKKISLLRSVNTKINSEASKHQKVLIKIIKKNPSQSMRSEAGKSVLDEEVKTVKERLESKIALLCERRWNEVMANVVTPEQNKQLNTAGRKLALELQKRGTHASKEEIVKKFEVVWKRITEGHIEEKTPNIPQTAQGVMMRCYPTNPREIGEELIKHPLSSPICNLAKEAFHDSEMNVGGEYVVDNEAYNEYMWHSLTRKKTPWERMADIVKAVVKCVESKQKGAPNVASHVYEIVQMIQKEIKKQAKNNEKFQFTPACERKLVVQSIRYAIPLFEHRQKRFDVKYGYKSKLKERHDRVLHMFTAIVKDAETDEGLPRLVSTELEGYLKEYIVNLVLQDLKCEVKNELNSKSKLVGLLHQNFIDQKVEFDCYMAYLKDPQEPIYDNFIDWINMKYFAKQVKSEKRIVVLAAKHIKTYMGKIQNCIRNLQEKYRGCKRPIRLRLWVQDFVRLLYDENIPLHMSAYGQIGNWIEIENPDAFADKVAFIIGDEQRKTLHHYFSTVTSDSIFEDEQIMQELFQDLWGCGEKCPLCGEVCESNRRYHLDEKKHWCHTHRPLAIQGPRSIDHDGALNTRNCTFVQVNVEKTSRYWSSKKKTPHHPHIFDNWEIDRNVELTKYWRWFIFKHRRDLEKFHGTRMPSIPNHWKKITKIEAQITLNIGSS